MTQMGIRLGNQGSVIGMRSQVEQGGKVVLRPSSAGASSYPYEKFDTMAGGPYFSQLVPERSVVSCRF